MPPVRVGPPSQIIVVAVDFGTTYSSVAWGQTGESVAQNIIKHWPDQNSSGRDVLHARTIDYVPTTLMYQDNGSGGYRWGYQINGAEPHLEWFKLGLDETMQRDRSSLATKYPVSTRLPMQRYGYEISPAKLTTDYLRALYEHVKYILTQTVVESALKGSGREYIITVPAVWSRMAQDLTISCAVNAGLGPRGKLHIVSEPEAAVIYAFKEMNSCGLQQNDTFVVVDAGGGTVDLISYTVLSLAPVLQLGEAAPGSGGACGSTFLNRIFAKFLNDKFRGDPVWDDEEDGAEIFATAMECFETSTKVSFNGVRDEQVPVPGLGKRPGIKHHRLTLSSAELKAIFEPVISEVITLIRDQIQQTESSGKSVKLILLVGGFGNNFYLKQRIQETFGTGFEVKVAPECQTAVVRGALMKGFADIKDVSTKLPRVRVESRKARKHLGSECCMDYKPREKYGNEGHSPERAQKHDFTGDFHVKYMRWFVRKGQDIQDSEPKSFSFQTDQLVSAGLPLYISLDLYCYDDPYDGGAPIYRTKDVVNLGPIKADIRSLDPELLKIRRGGDGQDYYELNFDIEVTFHAAKIEFTPVYRFGVDGRRRFKPMEATYH